MQAIKLVTGVTPTCWRVCAQRSSSAPSRQILILPQPPFGDVDDRIRAIANGLGLRTIIWRYDSFDWKAGFQNVTAADVDRNYEAFLAKAHSGVFDHVSSDARNEMANN
jgi:hypothetical protein